MRATFADESWQRNFWFEHIVLAHINFNQDLDWFYQLIHNLKSDDPDGSFSITPILILPLVSD